ncbi:helix-turn-helix domain-containing protein [Rhodobacteraceae bacterium LMO-12]|nr:helix-turn-helix domain-containing protein [Rhodobacteraceae bacterium LMO-JJ12]
MKREQYQTVKEVADLLKVSEATVRGWIKNGELHAFEIGKGWRIADSDLETFLSNHSTRAKTPGAQENEIVQIQDSEHESNS